MMNFIWMTLACFLVTQGDGTESPPEMNDKSLDLISEQFEDNVVVADAVFQGVYVGVVRMIQKISDDDGGFPDTTVIVRLKHKANDSVSVNHMWHVEHDPITGIDCAASNKHFAPFGITKQTNYTTYCSAYAPDYCEIGDISTKTTLTSVGKDVIKLYKVPMLPVVGPYTVIGHSVNVHGGGMSKVRQACGNIVFNQRMTQAKEVILPVNIPATWQPMDVGDARMKIARGLKIPISKVQTAVRMDTLGTGCTDMPFLIFGRGTYDPAILDQLLQGKVDIGNLSPVGCSIIGKTIGRSDSKSTSCGEKMKPYKDNDGPKREEEGELEVVADAVFRGPYVGVVRMTQKITSSSDGYPLTKVVVRLKYADNDNTTINHMWHVEHDPIADVTCADANKHFAPYGITKETNYTTYCSRNTPDYCELGDISTKTTLTSVGKNVVKVYTVPLLPIVGPTTVIGHSVNIHGSDMSKVRTACGNIELNTRATKAKMVNIPVNMPIVLNGKDLVSARIKMAEELGISLSKIHTAVRLDTVSSGTCVKLQFLIFDRGTYCPTALKALEDGKVDIGPLSPSGCTFSRGTVTGGPDNGSTHAMISQLLPLVALTTLTYLI